ncbi:hypothetical protein SLS60_000272 [Paraconiothyrium brasiliense]|uniref:Uncharacterized protein n=1 Tax=Paraconiothyrium brasiliense TaxID=300254 RepID=A0ABR3S5S7_9PLEO
MFNLSESHLAKTSHYTYLTKQALAEYFRLALAIDSDKRATSVIPLVHVLQNAVAGMEQDEGILETIVLEKPGDGIPLDIAYFQCTCFDVATSMVQLYDVDYRVRNMIFECLKNVYSETKDIELFEIINRSVSRQIAMCYQLGFGVRRDTTLAEQWVLNSSMRNQFSESLTALCATTIPLYQGWTKWAKWSNEVFAGHYERTNDMQYYRDQKLALTVIDVEKGELEDWDSALGTAHWIVRSRATLLLNKISNIGLNSLALTMAEGMLEQAQATLPPDHPVLSGMRVDLIKACLSMNKIIKAQELFYQVKPQLRDYPKCLSIIENEPDADFLRSIGEYGLLAAIKSSNKDPKHGEAILLQIIPRVVKLLGVQNLQCIKLQYNLVVTYSDQAKFKSALELINPLYDICRKSHGENHEMTLLLSAKRHALEKPPGWMKSKLKLIVRMRPGFSRDRIEACQKGLGNSHPYTLDAVNEGIDFLVGEWRYDEAARLAQTALEIVLSREDSRPDDVSYQRNKLMFVRTADVGNGGIGNPQIIEQNKYGAQSLPSAAGNHVNLLN